MRFSAHPFLALGVASDATNYYFGCPPRLVVTVMISSPESLLLLHAAVCVSVSVVTNGVPCPLLFGDVASVVDEHVLSWRQAPCRTEARAREPRPSLQRASYAWVHLETWWTVQPRLAQSAPHQKKRPAGFPPDGPLQRRSKGKGVTLMEAAPPVCPPRPTTNSEAGARSDFALDLAHVTTRAG